MYRNPYTHYSQEKFDQEHKKYPGVDCNFTLDQYHVRLNEIIKNIEPLNLRWDIEKFEEKFSEYLFSPSSDFDQFVDAVHCTVQRQKIPSLDDFKRIVVETLETKSANRAKAQETCRSEITNADTTRECSSASPETKSRKICFCNTCGKCFIKFWKGRSQVKRIGRKSSPVTTKFATMKKPQKRRARENHKCLSCKKDQGSKPEHDTNHAPNKKDTEPVKSTKAADFNIPRTPTNMTG